MLLMLAALALLSAVTVFLGGSCVRVSYQYVVMECKLSIVPQVLYIIGAQMYSYIPFGKGS